MTNEVTVGTLLESRLANRNKLFIVLKEVELTTLHSGTAERIKVRGLLIAPCNNLALTTTVRLDDLNLVFKVKKDDKIG
jgi:hypothetical protein